MIDISPELITVIMLGGVFIGVLTGFPLAIPIGGMTIIMGFLLYGTPSFHLIYSRVFSMLTNYTLLAVPCFIFMGGMLERSGIAARMYDALYLWLGGLRGGLAIVTILLGTVLAACVGVIAASITMLAMVALPAMLNRGYDKGLASGAVIAGGCLGILIPPSIMLIIYGPMALISVGQLFMAAFMPGFLLSGLYMGYVAIRCAVSPHIGPPIAVSERAVPFAVKSRLLLTSLLPTALLILAVLGVIFLGVAAPTEASASGALVATMLALAYRKLNLKVLYGTALETLRLTSMILLIGSCAFAFVGIFLSAGCGRVVEEFILSAPGGRWGAFAMVMFVIFILGFFIDWIGILFIVVPIISPLAPALGFSPLWFAMMICINLQSSFMTPPFAVGIFFLRGSASPSLGLTMSDIIRGVIPFVILVLVALVLCIFFPSIITWLPSMLIR
ncbi:MAG: TRAP transporter large permease subunit [Dehalococcoidia bacterium]|nr:TRAP transporter large permease subunit [Dehalococcoidia bacterium]